MILNIGHAVTADALLSTNNRLGQPGRANLIYYLLQASTDERKRYIDYASFVETIQIF